MMAFNPNNHITKIKGKDYLPARARVQWFRHDYPVSEGKGRIITEIVSIAPAIVQAKIIVNGEIVATGTAQAIATGNAVYKGREIEKAETSAISRALAIAGYGTEFTNEFDDSDHLADSPQPSTASAPLVATDAGQGDVPETGTEGDDDDNIRVTQIVKAEKIPRKGGTMIRMTTAGGKLCTMFSADLLRDGGHVDNGKLAEVGDVVEWAEDKRPTVKIVIDGQWLNVVEVESVLDASFPRDNAQLPGMPPQEEVGVDFYGEERAQ